MKKTIDKTIPFTDVVISSQEVWTCDICGKEKEVTTCSGCGRDVCMGCAKEDPEEKEEEIDQRDKYCPICYKLKFETYLKERVDLTQKYIDDMNFWDKKIKEESLTFKEEKDDNKKSV